MGREKSKLYHKDIHRQAYEKLTSMQAFGESRHRDKRDGSDKEKIYSYKTYETYWQQTRYFLKWLRINHPGCKNLKKAKKYVNLWLEHLVEQGYSAWTIHTACAALCKLYGIDRDDPKRFRPPIRHRADIKRSRGVAARDRDFSVTNNYEKCLSA